MRLLFVSHGYPPELWGGTERSVQALARGAARAGHQVWVLSGSLQAGEAGALARDTDRDPESGAEFEVLRVTRGDLYFDHWHKSACPAVGRRFDALLAELQPDVVHVHHWLRLTRDLVARAARAGVRSVVSLHDLWTSCLLTFRVRPDTRLPCHEPLGARPCIACAVSATVTASARWPSPAASPPISCCVPS